MYVARPALPRQQAKKRDEKSVAAMASGSMTRTNLQLCMKKWQLQRREGRAPGVIAGANAIFLAQLGAQAASKHKKRKMRLTFAVCGAWVPTGGLRALHLAALSDNLVISGQKKPQPGPTMQLLCATMAQKLVQISRTRRMTHKVQRARPSVRPKQHRRHRRQLQGQQM